jgi:hypothetical protein
VIAPETKVELTEGKKRLARLREEEATYNVWNTSYNVNFIPSTLIPQPKVVEPKDRVPAGERRNSPYKRAPVNPITHTILPFNLFKQ